MCSGRKNDVVYIPQYTSVPLEELIDVEGIVVGVMLQHRLLRQVLLVVAPALRPFARPSRGAQIDAEAVVGDGKWWYNQQYHIHETDINQTQEQERKKAGKTNAKRLQKHRSHLVLEECLSTLLDLLCSMPKSIDLDASLATSTEESHLFEVASAGALAARLEWLTA